MFHVGYSIRKAQEGQELIKLNGKRQDLTSTGKIALFGESAAFTKKGVESLLDVS
jgi:hypothetical protein